jgi:integrase/recombinase XerC
MKAYRQDFAAIASVVTNGEAPSMKVVDITKDSMRAAFAAYAHFLCTGEQLAANPMQLVGRPKLAKALSKALPRTAVEALLETVAQDRDYGAYDLLAPTFADGRAPRHRPGMDFRAAWMSS